LLTGKYKNGVPPTAAADADDELPREELADPARPRR